MIRLQVFFLSSPFRIVHTEAYAYAAKKQEEQHVYLLKVTAESKLILVLKGAHSTKEGWSALSQPYQIGREIGRVVTEQTTLCSMGVINTSQFIHIILLLPLTLMCVTKLDVIPNLPWIITGFLPGGHGQSLHWAFTVSPTSARLV